MKKFFSWAAIICTLMLLTGCRAYKKVPYIKNWEEVDLSPATKLYDAKIMPKDELAIIVNYPTDPAAVSMFNLQGARMAGNVQATSNNVLGGAAGVGGNNYSLSYLVDNGGYINFPLLGRLKVTGMTINQLEDYIAGKIKGTYTNEAPVVTVRMSNFKVTVIGEVGRSGVVTASSGKLNIFEALAQSGDITLYGLRDEVKIIREDARGEKTIAIVNLNDADIINSPYYQLQQNDIIYVRPSNVKAKGADWGNSTTIFITSLSLLMSIATFVINVAK